MAVGYLLHAAMLALRPYAGEIGAPLVIAGVLIVVALGLAFYGRASFNKARIVPARLSRSLTKTDSRKGAS
jgi:hypothetical protein